MTSRNTDRARRAGPEQRRSRPLFRARYVGVISVVAACQGPQSGNGAWPSGTRGGAGALSDGGSTGGVAGADGGGGTSGSGVAGGGEAPDAGPFEPVPLATSVRKVKNLLTGLAPTDAEMTAAAAPGGLSTLIDGWMGTPQFQPKMLKFFRNLFQQSQFATADFEAQLRSAPGAFNLPYGLYGDGAFPGMFQNLQESVARTALYYVANGQPLSNILTTNQFMMTTGLLSLYLQVEMPYDIHTFNWKFQQGSRPALADTLNPASPSYGIWGYAKPTTISFPNSSIEKNGEKCAGSATVSTFPGNVNLYQVLLGVVPRDTTNGCFEHAIQPYITPEDQSDWRLVTLRPLSSGESETLSYDLITLRKIASGGSLGLRANRVGFFSTPAFDAVWNTNDSNQHRVTANQALLAALGEGFTSVSVSLPAQPVSTTGLDPGHAVNGSDCITCHQSLDPMRQFWANVYDFNDVPITNPPTTGGVFAFANVNQTGESLGDFGKLLLQVVDGDPTSANSVNRFALNVANQLCFFANSAPCASDDPAFRSIVRDFVTAGYDFKTLVRELFSSPLVTDAADTATFDEASAVVSIARRDQFCDALSNRMGVADLCNVETPTPDGTDITNPSQNVTRLASAISADAFSRGAEIPVTPSEPDLFFRAAVELVCENLAARLVDAAGGPYASTSPTTVGTAVDDMVTKLLAYPPSDVNHASAVTILKAHDASTLASGATPTNALRSTFVAACESPTSVSIGL